MSRTVSETPAMGPSGALSHRTAAHVFLFVALSSSVLAWAKWWPYWHRIVKVLGSHAVGRSIITNEHDVVPHPSWHTALHFANSYFHAVWMAVLAALVIAAGVETLLPRDGVARTLSRGWRGLSGPAVAGMAAMPSMLCTCCAAPVAVSLRRQGVPVSSTLAYFLANPLLNPVVLVFTAIVLPWQWVTVRVVAGIVLVFVIAPLLARLAPEPAHPVPPASSSVDLQPSLRTARPAPVRFVHAFGRLTVTLLPEYVVIVTLLGGLRGWLFPVGGHAAALGPLAVVVYAVAGTVFAIPTAGEIPIIQGFLAAGASVSPVGALLITLPAVSAPSLIMTARSLRPRVAMAVAGAVVALGVCCGGLLALLT